MTDLLLLQSFFSMAINIIAAASVHLTCTLDYSAATRL
ncbi:hypothetical protein J2801_005164 [Paraburkholderia phenoliruptrix]|nr:hypothetical protein [Paraburkholderia phenoliruptrix]